MGPAPGQRKSYEERPGSDTEKTRSPDILRSIKDQPPAPKYTPDCTDTTKKDECFLQWRAAVAAEAQARYAYDQVQYAWYGSILLFLTLIATAGATIAAAISAKAASRSAKASERALTGLERPHVFVEIVSAGLQIEPWRGSYSLAGGRFEYQCVNLGRSIAALTEYLPKVLVLKDGEFPSPVDPHKEVGRFLPVGCVAAQGTPYVEGDTAMKTYDWKVLDDGSLHKYKIFFVGYVRYSDMVEGTKHIHGFCYVYDAIGAQFVRRGNNVQYNYTRVEKPAPDTWRTRLRAMWEAARGRAA